MKKPQIFSKVIVNNEVNLPCVIPFEGLVGWLYWNKNNNEVNKFFFSKIMFKILNVISVAI